jgi:large subunit ribosomal protein L24
MKTKPKSHPAKPHKHKIVKGDRVRVIRGNYRDQDGNVLRVIPDKNQVVVEGVNVRKHHQRPSPNNQEGGIASFEEPIHISNVMLIDPTSGEPSRIRWRLEENNVKERIAAKSGNPIPKPK